MKQKVRKAIIPAAGLGTRFLPATKALAKEMLPIVDTPTIQYIIQEAVDSGIEEILIITNSNKHAMENHFDKSYELEARLTESGKMEQVKMIQDILNIVRYTYNIDLDEKSLSYERFVTHLRFFFQRLNKKDKFESKNDDFLLNQVKIKYKEAYRCMLKVEKYLQIELNDEEKLYLTLHIQRITQK